MSSADPRDVIEAVFRESYAVVLSGLATRFRDIDLAEEAVQDALVEALRSWPEKGIPDNPPGWISAVAQRRGIDRIRRQATLVRKTSILAGYEKADHDGPSEIVTDSSLGDDRLQMLFACCHPSLATDKQVALTLRTVGGLTTLEIAHAFLVPEPTMAQRLAPIWATGSRRCSPLSISCSTRATSPRPVMTSSGPTSPNQPSGWAR